MTRASGDLWLTDDQQDVWRAFLAATVVIDDALGFTDPDRLARMAEVFDLAGADGQVIVLTCAPERFDAIADAHRIDLGDGAPGPVVHEVGPAA